MPSDVILEGLCKSESQDSVQLQDRLGFERYAKFVKDCEEAKVRDLEKRDEGKWDRVDFLSSW